MSYGFTPIQITFGGLSWAGANAPGVSTISAIDSSFDGDEFLTFAQGAFLRVQEARANGSLDDIRPLVSETIWPMFKTGYQKKAPKVTSIEHATIYDAHRDASWDSVTVRFAAKTDARKDNDFVEDWTFQRPAVNGQQQLPDECPSCGAPLSLDDNGECKYCRVQVRGARGGWKLVRAVPPNVAPDTKSTSGKGYFIGFIIFMVLIIVVPTLLIVVVVTRSTSNVVDSFGLNGNSGGQTDGPSVSSGTKEKIGVTTTSKFGKTSTTKTSTSPSGDGVSGSVALTGALTTAAEVTGAVPSGDARTCTTRAAALTTMTFASTSIDDADGNPAVMTVTVVLPPGSQGPGDYILGQDDVSLSITLAPVPAGGSGTVTPSQTWNIGPRSSVDFTLNADESGQLDFDTLAPSLPKSSGDDLGRPLSGTVSFDCS